MRLVPSRIACEILGMCPNTLRKYADLGHIKVVKNASGQRWYDVDEYMGRAKKVAVVCYCRVSSPKQKDDLARQVVFMREQYPQAEIVQDIGSALNFKRKGLRSLLERLLQGDKLTLVVAHKDRLARFGFELIDFLVSTNGGELLVLDRVVDSPNEELTKDLLQILHVFSYRMHGLRRYSKKISQDPDLSVE